MCRQRDSIRALDAAIEGLDQAVRQHIEAQAEVDDAPPIARNLRLAFDKGSVTPTDMLNQLRKMK